MLFIVVFPWQTAGNAQVPVNLSSRLSQLESDTRRLQSRVSRLETELARVDRNGSGAIAEPAVPPGAIAADDPMFDRLATLVIEMREQLNALEARVMQLETSSQTDG
jgi:hypothetical protein